MTLPPVAVVDLDHLGEAAGVADHVGEEDGEGLVADDLARAPDRVAEAERLLLAGEADGAGRRPLAHQLVEGRLLVAVAERRLELVGDVEMILDRHLAAAGDHDEMLDSGRARLLDRVLDDRLVDHGQHLLRHRLGGGKEAGAEAGDGEDGGAEARRHVSGPFPYARPDDRTKA